MSSITAKALKAKGVSIVGTALQQDRKAVITVHGKPKYVVLDLSTYNKFLEYELNVALHEARQDMANGNHSTESVGEHMKRVLG